MRFIVIFKTKAGQGGERICFNENQAMAFIKSLRQKRCKGIDVIKEREA